MATRQTRTNHGWSAVVLASVIGGWAQTATERAVPGIEVTATRTPAELVATPASVVRLDANALTFERGARSLPEAMAAVPSVLPQRTANGQGSPFLRGFTGFRTLLLVDGIRLNHAAMREGPNQYWATVDMLSLRSIEAVLGPGSVLYGSDAIGGTVQAFTPDPPDAAGTMNGRLLYRAASAERSQMARAEAAARPDETVGFHVGLSLKDIGDIEGGRSVGRQPHTGYDEWAADGKLVLRLSDQADLTVGHQSVRQDDVWRTHRTIYGITWKGLQRGTDQYLFYDQARDLTWARLSLRDVAPALTRLTATVYRQWHGEDEYRMKEDGARTRQGFDVVGWGGGLQLETETDAFRWVYGVDVSRDLVDTYSHKLAADGSVKSRSIQGPIADDATYDLFGVYVQPVLGGEKAGWMVVPGARYSHVRLEAERVAHPLTGERFEMEHDWNSLIGSVHGSLSFDDDRRGWLFAGVAQGFRAPNLSDMSRFDIARSGEQEVPVENLDPERYVSAEIGARWHDDRLRGQVVAYRTWMDAMIVRAPTGRVVGDGLLEVTKKNAGDGWIHGVEAIGEWEFVEDWSVRALGAWMDGEVESYPTSEPRQVREPVSRLLPPTGELALRYGPGRWWVEAAVRGSAKADQLAASDRRDTQRIPPGGTPAWLVGSVRAGATLWRDVRAAVGVENITDEDYRIHGSGVNEPGRNFVLTLDARF
ncbi:MAG: TonB-dependent receptor [Kiritimatiellae bacterium]|nr:TonB-dependent receptor [Kiritimatiellia bacterium]